MTPFENADLKAKQIAARIFLFSQVNQAVVQDEVLDEQQAELLGIGFNSDVGSEILQMKREVNQLFVNAGCLLEELDGVVA